MRIKSGGPSQARGAKEVKSTSKAKGAQFAGLLDPDGRDSEEKAREVRSALLEELASLARDVEDGNTTKEEASRKFAGLVIRERFGDPEKSKGSARMADTIGDLVESDPNFVSRLQVQLKKLAKS